MTASSSNMRSLRILASIKKASTKLNRNFGEALARLDEATSRVVALGDIHLKLAATLMNTLGITSVVASVMPPLRSQIDAMSLSMRAEMLASGLLRPVIRSLSRPTGEIAEAIRISEERISKETDKFDMTEMDILAAELGRTPGRVLSLDERVACTNKVREWVHRLRDIISEPDT